MMDDQVIIDKRQKRLEELITEKQKTQLAGLLSSIMENGFGELTIVIEKGQVRFFQPQLSIQAYFHGEEDL